MWQLFQLIVSLLLLIGMLVSSPTRAEAFLGFCFTSKTRGKKGACSRTPAGFLKFSEMALENVFMFMLIKLI